MISRLRDIIFTPRNRRLIKVYPATIVKGTSETHVSKRQNLSSTRKQQFSNFPLCGPRESRVRPPRDCRRIPHVPYPKEIDRQKATNKQPRFQSKYRSCCLVVAGLNPACKHNPVFIETIRTRSDFDAKQTRYESVKNCIL